MFLAYQQLLTNYPDLPQRVEQMPLRVFSGKEHPNSGARAVFFCYQLPARDAVTGAWDNDEASITKWYLYDLHSGHIEDDATRIFTIIESMPETPRHIREQKSSLTELRRKIDNHISNTYLKKVQAPAGVFPTLLAWMELS